MTDHPPQPLVPSARLPTMAEGMVAARRIYAVLLLLLLGPTYVLAYTLIGDRSHAGVRSPHYNYAVGAYDSPVEFVSWVTTAAAAGGTVAGSRQ